jgi:RHS repeat-associated protein
MYARIGIAFSIVLLGFVPLDLTAGQIGRTAGDFTVPADGSANYSIPIWTPPGVAGLQPNLALSYNSGSGDGLLGVGWGLAGLSAISRCNLTYSQDGVAGSPQLTSSDRFCLDGNRLRTTNGSTYGAAGATYQTEIANFSNITSNGTAGSGPAWFRVQAKNGLAYEYGNTTDSAILAVGTSSVRVWALNAVRDRSGNAMTFAYTNDTTNGSYRIASIQYTYTGSSTTNNGYSVVFTYQSRSSADQIWNYTIGGVNNQLNYLSSITVNTVSGSTMTMVHGYELTYATSPTTSRLRISSIQECASSTTDCFPATTIGYQNGATGWGGEIADSGNATNILYALPVDVNGDGIDDLVYPDPASGHWYYELGTPSGAYLGPYDTGIASTNYQSALAIDFYVNGRKDILVPNASNNWRVLQFVSAGAAFSYLDTTTSAAGVVPGSAIVGDVDGDGREDLIYAVSGGSGFAQSDYIYYRLNTGGAFSTTQGTLASFPNGVNCTPCVKLGNSEPFGNPTYRFTSQIRKLDFNGDGRTDFLVYLATCDPASRPSQCGQAGSPIIYSWNIFLSQPNGAYIGADVINYSVGTTPGQPPLIGDFNGDGCTDVAYTVNSYWVLQFGTCGRAGTSNVLGAPVGTVVPYYSAPALAIDWDGDGRTDIVEPGSGTSPDWGVGRSVGNTLSAWTDIGISTENTGVTQVADVNGDGLEDLIYAVSNTLKTRVHAGVAPDLVTGFADAYGVTYSPSYVPLPQASSSVYVKGGSQTYPYQDYDGPQYVVPSYTASDGIGGNFTIMNYYSAAVVNLQGRGFQGFQGVRANDSRTGIYDFKYYSTSFPTTGLVSEDDTLQANDTTDIRTLTNALTDLTLDGTTNNQRYFPYVSSSTAKAYEVGGAENGQLITTSLTTYGTPDSYGNFSSVETTLIDNDPGSPYLNQQWTTTTATSYAEDGGVNWCLTMPTERDVTNTAPGVPAITRHVSYSPDYTNCRETQQVVEPTSSTYRVTTALGYDSFGNLNSQTVTGVGMAPRTSGINWGASGQFPTILTNALSQQTLVNFDPNTGKQLSQTDPNGIITSWQYDTFARKTKEIRPDGTSTTWTRSACTSSCGWSNSVYQIAQTAYQTNGTTAIRTDTTSYDPFDRVTQIAGPTVTGSTATVQKLYNPMGLPSQQSVPFLSGTPYQQSFYYDVLNRLTSVTRPISSTNSTLQTTGYSYAGRTSTVTDPYGHTKTTITDVNGWLRQTKDALGYSVTKAYDSAGSLIGTTDSAGNSLLKNVTYAYGIKPFLLGATDADRGAWSYIVDSLGERTGWTDAKGQSFSMTYDALSRPLTRTEPDRFSQWVWGSTPASYNVGQLIYECSTASSPCGSNPGYSESRSFDTLGRLSTRSIIEHGNPGNDPGGVLLITLGYSTTTGLLNTLTYPMSTSSVALRLQYGYGYGLLSSVTDTSDIQATCGNTCTLWTANAMNAFGQVTQETLGNGVVSNRTYDGVTSWLSAATAGVGGGAGLLNQSYLEDENGNIIQRQNNNLGLTESFAYDADNRVTCAALSSTCTTPTMIYDGGAAGPGNITSQTGVGTYSYPTAGQPQPHAVTSLTGTFLGVVNPTFSYDANGNMTARAGSNITWTSYNYPAGINGYTDPTGSEGVTFVYGPDRQRWKQTYIASITETTYYVGGLMDAVYINGATDYRHYIYAGREPIAVYSRTTAGVNTMSYMLEDHQGSLSAITSNAGVSDVGESFTAFGQRRNPATWSGAPTTTDLNTIAGLSRQGYTFQTWLGQSMGLNDMNGRVQDAILGRFLSPDPHIPDPTNAQSYNRYSYVNNNPLTLVDPTGFKSATLCYGGVSPLYMAKNPTVNLPECSQSLTPNAPLWPRGGGGWNLAGNIGTVLAEFDTTLGMFDGIVSSDPSNAASTDASSDPKNAASTDVSSSAQTQSGADPCAAGGCLPEQTVTGQGESQGQGPDISTAPSVDGIPAIIVTAARTRPTSIFMSTWSYAKIATQHLWFPFANTSQFLPRYNSYTGLFGLAGTIFGRGAANGYIASNGMWVAYANLGQPVGTDQAGNLTNYGTIVVFPNPDSPNLGEVISMYPGQPGNIPQY